MLSCPRPGVSGRPLHEGYDDEQLMRLSTLQRRTEAGLAPWASWEVENSSFGKTLREWIAYPSWLPLCASSDHGVHWESRCWPNELESPYRLFLTWNEKKSRLMRERHGREALHVPHPWMAYREKHYPATDPDRVGTLVFFTHSNATGGPVFESLDEYMYSLRDLPARFQPVVICLSFHDVRKGLHLKLKPYGFPIITAGTTNSQNFVDRFYGMISAFRYACSPDIGSHSYYAVEAGLPFFLYGPAPMLVSRGSKALTDGAMDPKEYGDDEDIERYLALHRLFSEPVDEVGPEQRLIVQGYLGKGAATTAEELGRHMRASLRRNLPRVMQIYLQQTKRIAQRAFQSPGGA